MVDVAFYHLTTAPLERALPKLLEKTIERGKRAVVRAGSPERVEALNGLLWTYGRESWLPHGSARDGNAADQPIWLTAVGENPNGALYLFLVDGAEAADAERYERVFDLFDGNDPAALEAARARWRAHRAAGHALAYWEQGEGGGWQRRET